MNVRDVIEDMGLPGVLILSGIPGSGKTHLTRKIRGEYIDMCHVSADHHVDYTLRINHGTFAKAHDACRRDYLTAIMIKKPQLIVVDNTNLSAWEIAPYYLFAETMGYNAHILRIQTPFEVCLERQAHAVPEKTMQRMRKNFERRDVLPWWSATDYEVTDKGLVEV